MIPEEAVEAAAREVHDEFCRDPYHAGHIGPACYDYRHEARTILEAAAPHMVQAIGRGESCPTRLMDGRNEIRCWLPAGHDGACK